MNKQLEEVFNKFTEARKSGNRYIVIPPVLFKCLNRISYWNKNVETVINSIGDVKTSYEVSPIEKINNNICRICRYPLDAHSWNGDRCPSRRMIYAYSYGFPFKISYRLFSRYKAM